MMRSFSFPMVALLAIISFAMVGAEDCPADTDEFFFNLYPGNSLLPFTGKEWVAPVPTRIKIRYSVKQAVLKICINSQFGVDFSPALVHLREGNMMENGGVIFDFSPFVSQFSPTVKGCLNIDSLTASKIVNNPSGFYIDALEGVVGTAGYSSGLRGQIMQTVSSSPCPYTQISPFSGVFDSGATGKITFMDGGAKMCIKVSVNGFSPVIGQLHEGAAGENGLKLLNYESVLTGRNFDGCVDVLDSTLAVKILKDPSSYYLNILAAPASTQYSTYGIRGQLTPSAEF